MKKLKKIHEKRSAVAYALLNNLKNIESRSGVFLVKPMYSHQLR
jgi:hypothetical protein